MEGYLHALLISAPKEVSGQLFAPALYPPKKMPRYSLEKRLGEVQSRHKRDGEEFLIMRSKFSLNLNKRVKAEKKNLKTVSAQQLQFISDMAGNGFLKQSLVFLFFHKS